MSVINNLRTVVKQKIEALTSVQKVFGYVELAPDGWPAVWVLPGNMNGEFTSTTENRRVYAFDVYILFPIGQDFDKTSGLGKEEYAENVVGNVMEDIINAFDTDFTLEDDANVLFVDAADAEWGIVAYGGGEAKTARITLMFNMDFNVSS